MVYLGSVDINRVKARLSRLAEERQHGRPAIGHHFIGRVAPDDYTVYNCRGVYEAAQLFLDQYGKLPGDVDGTPVLARCCVCGYVIFLGDEHGNTATGEWAHLDCPSNLLPQRSALVDRLLAFPVDFTPLYELSISGFYEQSETTVPAEES